MNVSDFVSAQLALFGWREGKRLAPGNIDAAIGLMHVIRNRVMAGWLGGDWLKILNDWPIHSANLIEELDFRTLPEIDDPYFRKIAPQAELIYSGGLRDSITTPSSVQFAMPRADALGRRTIEPALRSGLFWADLNRVTRPWFRDNILDQREQHPILAHSLPVTFIG